MIQNIIIAMAPLVVIACYALAGVIGLVSAMLLIGSIIDRHKSRKEFEREVRRICNRVMEGNIGPMQPYDASGTIPRKYEP